MIHVLPVVWVLLSAVVHPNAPTEIIGAYPTEQACNQAKTNKFHGVGVAAKCAAAYIAYSDRV